MEWLKRNAALALGIGMPLALMAVFLLAAWLPSLWVQSPHYDVVYITGYYETSLRYSIQDKHLVVESVPGNRTVYYNNYNTPKFYRYSPATGSLQEIPVPLPAQDRAPQPQSQQQPVPENPVRIAVPELDKLTLDASTVSPDGYEFRVADYRSSDLFNLFFSSGDRGGAVLTKGGHIVRLPRAGGDFYYPNVKFIGWVVP